MKNQETTILEFLSSNPKSDANTISTATTISRAEVLKTLKSIEAKVTVFQKSSKSVKLFSAVVPVEVKVEAKVVRDLSKFTFNSTTLNKGQLALSIVKAIAKSKRCTLDDLKGIFPKSVNSYGVLIKPADEAISINERGKKLYFTNEDQLIKLKGGVVVAVTNQIGIKNINAIIEIGKLNNCVIE